MKEREYDKKFEKNFPIFFKTQTNKNLFALARCYNKIFKLFLIASANLESHAKKFPEGKKLGHY